MQPADHVVILDDDYGTLALTRRRLEHAGFKVSAASSVKDAKALIGSDGSGADLVIADFALEGEEATGLDFLRSLTQEGLRIPSILMTGYVTEERILDSLRSGVSDVIRKNDGYLELLPSVARRVLDTFRMHKDLMVAEESRRYYHLISNGIPHLVYTVAVDGNLLYANAPWTLLTGFALDATTRYDWVDVLVAEEDAAKTKEVFGAALPSREFAVVHRFKHHAGELRWFNTRGVVVSVDGGIDTWLLTSTDIDPQHRAAQEIQALLESERLAREAAETATRTKDEFIATVSHELRSPLNAVVGWTEVLLRDPNISDKQKSGLEVILRNAKAQAKMIDDLLDISSVLKGRMRLEAQTVDLSEVIDMAVLTVQPMVDSKGIELRHKSAPSSPSVGDPARLQQVLWNLLINAVKFTDKGGYVEVSLVRDRNDYLIVVEDSGRGIAAEFLPFVFERFKQETTPSQHTGGLGLGLAITRELVELHGGTIAVESRGPGHGARFLVRLPSAGGATTKEPDSRENPGDALRDVRVLVVEDEIDALDFIVAGLESQGAQVTPATSATEALTRFYATRPDLVLSDLGLGKEDGYSLIRAIRDYERRQDISPTPAVALTALTRPEDRHRSIAAGFNAHLAKPVDMVELLRVLGSFVEGAVS